MYIEWPQTDLKRSNVKIALYIIVYYTLSIHPRGPNVRPFRSTNSHFQDTRLLKIGNVSNDLRLTLKSYFIYTKYLRDPIFRPFCSTTSLFSRYKVAKNLKCIEWPQNDIKHLKVKSTYIKYLPTRPNFCSVSLYHQPFKRYHTFYNFPFTTMLNGQKRAKKKKMPKPQDLKFGWVYMNFGKQIWCASEEMSFEIFPPIWSH